LTDEMHRLILSLKTKMTDLNVQIIESNRDSDVEELATIMNILKKIKLL